jgi:hypothetical protein
VDANESASNAADVVLQNNITTLGNTVSTNATNTTASLALKENAANKSTTTTLGTSDVLFPTQNAVKTYVDGNIATVNAANTATQATVTTLQNTVTTNATNTGNSIALKENTANKSTTTTLGTSDVLFPTQNAVKTYVDAQVASATIADATSSVKGKIQLAGDLGGTAAAPTVPGLALKAPLASPTFTGTVTSPIYASTPQALTDAATINWNPSNGLNASVTLGGNRTLSFASTPAIGSYGTLIVTQDATGNRTITLPSTSNKVLGSASTTTIALSTAANAKDILNFYYDGSNCYWNIGQGYGTAAPAMITNLATGVSGTLPVANGGSGAATLTGYIKGNGTSAMTANATIPVADVTGAATIASPTFTGTPAGPTATAGTNTTQLATTAFVASALSTSGLPSQSGNNGKYLTTNGSSASWASPSSGITGSGTVNSIPKFSTTTALSNSSLSDDGTGLRIGNPNGTAGVYTGLSSYDNTRLMVSGGREYESIRMTFPGDPYNNELSFNWYGTAWRMRTERSSGDITDLSFWRTAGGTTTEAIRIKASGNFGIGINPSQKLDVAGNVKFSGALMPNNSAGTSGQVLTSAGANAVPTWTTPASSGVPYTGATGAVNLGAYNLTVNEITIGKGNGSLSQNTVVGKSAMANVTGNNNTAIGSQSMPSLTSGAGNTAIGSAAGYSLGTGSNNIIMGYNANMSGNPSNSIAIGTGIDVNTSNTIQLGNSSSTTLKTFAKITSGTVTYPNTHNSVAGQVLTTDINGIATWANPSVSIPLATAMEGLGVTLNSSHNGYIFYAQNAGWPNFPTNLPDGFQCTIVNYSTYSWSSNTLSGLFYLKTTNNGTPGSNNSFTILPGGTAIVNVVTIQGAKRYYIMN